MTGASIPLIQIIHSVIDQAAHFLIGLIPALLAVAAPAEALEIIYIITRAALRDRLNMVNFQKQIISQPFAEAVQIIF